MSSPEKSRIAIVGAGSVGATIAYAAMIRGAATEIAIYDNQRKKVEAQVLDLNHGLQFVHTTSVEGSDDPAICSGASVIVITAGAKQKPGQTRMDLLAGNVEICRKLIPDLMKVAPDAIFLLVTNPVDVITYITMKLSGLPRNRVLGSGTVLDSSRFRFLIAQRCRIAVQSVHAYIAGEHGDSEIPLWSSAAIGSIPLSQWAVPGHGKLSVRDRTDIFQNVKNAAYQIVEGKGATHFAIGLATVQILLSILRNENRVLPVSSLIENFNDISDVCLSVPCVVGEKGTGEILPIQLNDAELAGLKHSAETIRQAIRSAGF